MYRDGNFMLNLMKHDKWTKRTVIKTNVKKMSQRHRKAVKNQFYFAPQFLRLEFITVTAKNMKAVAMQ